MTLAIVVIAGACGPGASPPPVPVRSPGVHTVYVALGASDSLGFGTSDPIRQAWPQRFFDSALPLGATFIELAVAGSTLGEAADEQLPYVMALRPTVVTVFFGVNDIRTGLTAAAFGSRLLTLLTELRTPDVSAGARPPTVLVANVPPLDRLPAYLACRPDPPAGAPPCSIAGLFPPPAGLNALVDAYNAGIAAAATATGSTVVDLHAAGLAARAAGTEAATVSADGLHPSAAGHRLIADAFTAAYRRLATTA